MVAARKAIDDPNDEVQYGERVQYVIVRGEPGAKLSDRAISPEELLKHRSGTFHGPSPLPLLMCLGFIFVLLWGPGWFAVMTS